MNLAKNRAVAIIPARGGSKRIPRKNIKNFCGKPIIAYSIEAALKSNCFDRVLVSTDDSRIATVAKKYGAQTPYIRSNKNSSDTATIADVVLEVLSELKRDGLAPKYCCLIYATAPTISTADIKRAFETLKKENSDAVIPVVEYEYPVQRALKISRGRLAFADEKNAFRRSQDLPTYYHDSGLFAFLKTKSFLKQKAIFMRKVTPLKVSRLLVQDIDTPEDWILAEFKHQKLNKK